MIKTQWHGDVPESAIYNPPVNALRARMRQRLWTAIAAAQTDIAVKAIVMDAIEASTKPVVAAIHGIALGGGLDVALGCDGRIATAIAKLGLLEVMLRLLPRAGGRQRLPRIMGAEA